MTRMRMKEKGSIDLPVTIGNEVNPGLVMLHTNRDFREYILSVVEDGDRELIRSLVDEVIDMTGLGDTLNSRSVRIDNIAFIKSNSSRV